MKYTLTVTKEEYDFIIKAMSAYVENLQHKLGNQAQTWLIKQESEKMIATTKAAPWGLKKDGTPKKQPGRKVSS